MEITIDDALQRGVAAHKEGKLQDAERLYRAILQSQPAHPDANHNLGVLALSVNKVSEAIPLFKAALEANPKIEQFWLSYIDALIKERKHDGARQVLEQAKQQGIALKKLQVFEEQLQFALSPGCDIPQQETDHQLHSHQDKLSPAIELRDVGKYKEAQEWLSKVIEHDSKNSEALSLLSQVLLLDKNEVEADRVLREAESINAELPSVYRNQARLLLKQSKTAEALEKARLGCKKSPEDSESLIVLAACLRANQKDAEALSIVEKVLKAEPRHAEAYANRALIKMRAHDTLGALEDVEMTVSLKPHLTQMWFLLGSLHYQNSNLSDAVEALRRAHEREPKNPTFMVQLGEFLRQDKKADEAITILTQATELAPNDVSAWTNLGVALQQEERLADAKIAYEKALTLNPNSATISSNLGAMAKECKDWESALSYFGKALEVEPNLAEVHSHMGVTLQELGRLEEAEASYKQAIALKPGYAEAHNNLGGTLQELGRLEEAEASLQEAINLKSDFFEAQYNLGLSLEESGDLQGSLRTYNLMVKSKSEPVSSTNRSEVVALLPFGRSGSLFLHSLVDGHPEIATLPGVYLKAWFGTEMWQKLAPNLSSSDWREHLVTIIVREFEPLFDANCKNNVIGKLLHNTDWLARDLGFTSMGPDRSQALSLNQDAFSQEFLSLLKPLSSLGISECFELIHQAFENSVRDKGDMDHSDNKTIFYHIHNPDQYEHLHFLKHYPEARFLQIIRNPVQSMESWMITSLGKRVDHNSSEEDMNTLSIREWRQVVGKIISMFRQILFPFHQAPNQVGIRLEDIKRNPREMMPKLASWMGVSDHEELYKSNFCGLQYWGPPSPTGSITGFDTKAIDTSIGRFLGARDIIIFETLFWPLSKKYAYTDMDEAAFHLRLAEIRPWLDEPLEFELRLYEQTGDHNSPIEALDPYIRLHQFMRLLWERLNRDEMYMGIPQPLMLT